MVIATRPRAAVRLAGARLTSPRAIRDRSYGAFELAWLRCMAVSGTSYTLSLKLARPRPGLSTDRSYEAVELAWLRYDGA